MTSCTTQQLIADILVFKANKIYLESVLLNFKDKDWLDLVKVGSSHLVLTTIYCRLQQKQLLDLLPKDLETYLHDLTAINRNRNKTIFKQIEALSQLLKSNNINHVFLKGAALLLSGYYKDFGERMIGDIDLLVDQTQIPNTIAIIRSNGYTKTFGYAYETIGFRHEDRLINPKELAALEIHSYLFDRPNNHLILSKTILDSPIINNGYSIPSPFYMCLSQVLSYQINDNAHYYNILGLKPFYDSLCLNLHHNQNAIAYLNKLKFGKSYLLLFKYYSKDVNTNTNYNSLRFRSYKLKQKHPLLGQSIFRIKRSILFIKKRLTLLVSNPFYRKHVFMMLKKKK